MRLKESILLGIAQGEQSADLVDVKGTCALQDGSRSCARSGGWKLKAEEQGPERKCMLVERITSHEEWPIKGRNLREILQASISTSSWTHLTQDMHAKRPQLVSVALPGVKGEREVLFVSPITATYLQRRGIPHRSGLYSRRPNFTWFWRAEQCSGSKPG